MSTFSGSVSQSTDDGSESSLGTVNLTASTTLLKSGSGNLNLWACRFTGLPANMTVSAASLSLFLGSSVSLTSTIHGNKTANPPTLANSGHYISGLALTTASVAWSGTGTANALNQTPDLTAVLNELISQPGWSGDVLFIFSGPSATGMTIGDQDGGNPAQLNITYTVPSSNTGSLLLMGVGS